jgi:hypothetical protein
MSLASMSLANMLMIMSIMTLQNTTREVWIACVYCCSVRSLLHLLLSTRVDALRKTTTPILSAATTVTYLPIHSPDTPTAPYLPHPPEFAFRGRTLLLVRRHPWDYYLVPVLPAHPNQALEILKWRPHPILVPIVVPTHACC